ncbi:MAG TPA: hypothetical protein VI122_21685 [Thermoleophilaceae bacterium]|jgi:hypothetical protein
MTHAAALHVLTPGSPAYAALKLSAIGGLVALRFVMSRRGKAKREHAPEQAAPPAPERRPTPHPVSARKKRRRRRG